MADANVEVSPNFLVVVQKSVLLSFFSGWSLVVTGCLIVDDGGWKCRSVTELLASCSKKLLFYVFLNVPKEMFLFPVFFPKPMLLFENV